MKIRNTISGDYALFWYEGNLNLYPWHVKGWWKSYGRKSFIKKQLESLWLAEMDYLWGEEWDDILFDNYASEWW